jgi:hypothetical protein
MFKLIFFLWRRQDFDRAAFIDYYENSHAIFGSNIVPRSDDYRRSYPRWDACSGRGADGIFGFGPFDVMTELWFRHRSGREAQLLEAAKPEVRDAVVADESRFMDRSKQAYFVVDERGSAQPGSSMERASAKIVHLCRQTPGISADEFIRRNEEERAPNLLRSIPGLVEYRRNYLVLSDPQSFAGGVDVRLELDPEMLGLSLMEEVWLDSKAAIQAAAKAFTKPDMLIDPALSFAFPVDEYRADFGEVMAPFVILNERCR